MGGTDEQKKEKQRKIQMTELPTLTYLSQRRKSEARSRIMLSAGGRGGRQVGKGGGRHRDSTDVREPAKSPWEAGGAGRPGSRAAGPQGPLADRTVLLQVCSLESVVGRIFPLPAPQLARRGFGQN